MNDQYPFNVPLIFIRTAWMKFYRGLSSDDSATGGGGYVEKHGYGEEIFNFQSFQGHVYGGCRPPGTKGEADGRINLRNLGGRSGDEFIPAVTVVWVAVNEKAQAKIVGWYKNATVFAKRQHPPVGSDRNFNGKACGYYVTTREEEAQLIPKDERDFDVPRGGEGEFGQSNVWYAKGADRHRKYRDDVLKYVNSWSSSTPQPNRSPSRQVDPLLRQRVEQAAVQLTTTHFTGLGYSVDSVERDNIGWDLNATVGRQELRLEVKGLSGGEAVVELTPNEYRAMQTYRDTYRVCVVKNALDQPRLQIFSYSSESNRWESYDGRILKLDEIVAVRCTAQ